MFPSRNGTVGFANVTLADVLQYTMMNNARKGGPVRSTRRRTGALDTSGFTYRGSQSAFLDRSLIDMPLRRAESFAYGAYGMVGGELFDEHHADDFIREMRPDISPKKHFPFRSRMLESLDLPGSMSASNLSGLSISPISTPHSSPRAKISTPVLKPLEGIIKNAPPIQLPSEEDIMAQRFGDIEEPKPRRSRKPRPEARLPAITEIPQASTLNLSKYKIIFLPAHDVEEGAIKAVDSELGNDFAYVLPEDIESGKVRKKSSPKTSPKGKGKEKEAPVLEEIITIEEPKSLFKKFTEKAKKKLTPEKKNK